MEDEEKLKKHKNKKEKFKNEVLEWMKSIALAVIVALVIKTFLFNTTYVLGNSMYPTLQEKDRLFVAVLPTYFGKIEKGDIVLLKAPDVPDKNYIKRVIALEGDIVEIKDGGVYVNDNLLEESYLNVNSHTFTYDKNTWQIRKGEVFVLGDNREKGASKDSRFFGCITLDSIKGIAKFRFYPINSKFGSIY